MLKKQESAALDIVWGASAIGQAIGRGVRETYYLLENNHLPGARKVGGRWCISRRLLVETFESAAA